MDCRQCRILHDVGRISRGLAAFHVSFLMVGFALGALGVGSVSDRLKRRVAFKLGVSAISVLAWPPLLWD